MVDDDIVPSQKLIQNNWGHYRPRAVIRVEQIVARQAPYSRPMFFFSITPPRKEIVTATMLQDFPL